MPDPRVQALRCKDCHRLRRPPTARRPNCACGSIRFVSTFPHPDEEQIALKLYAPEIEAANLYGLIAREVIADHQATNVGCKSKLFGDPGDVPEKKIIITR